MMDDDFWTRRYHYIHHSVLIQPVHDYRFCALATEGLHFARRWRCCHNVMAVGHEKRSKSLADCSSRACHEGLSSLFRLTSYVAGFVLIRNLLNPATDVRRNVKQLNMTPPDMRQIFDRRLIDQPDVGQIELHLLISIPCIVQCLLNRLATVQCQSACNTDCEHAIVGRCHCDLEHLIYLALGNSSTNADDAPFIDIERAVC